MQYSDGELRTLIRNVVREARATAKYETGTLKDSIKGDIIKRTNSIEFRQMFYGAYNNNSKLVEIAERMMPKDINWKVVFLDDTGAKTEIVGTTKTGRKIQRKQVTSGNIGTYKIINLISLIRKKLGKKEDDTTEGARG